MRRALVLIVVLAAVLGVNSVLTSAASAAPSRRHAAAAAAAAAGTYVPLERQARVVDTRTGANGNHRGAVAAGTGISPQIAGIAGVPSTGVASVAVTLSAVTPTGSGYLVAYPYGTTRPTTTNVTFAAGRSAVTGTAIVPLASGRLNVVNGSSAGSVQIVVDVSGYYTSGTPSASEPGIFHSVTPKRVVDTRYGTGGNHKGPVAGGTGIRPRIGGQATVPTEVGAVAVTITVLGGSTAGTIISERPDEPRQSYAYVHFAARQTTSGFAVLRTASGAANIVNTSRSSVHIIVDVVGYYTLGFAEHADTFQTRIQTRVQTSSLAARGTADVHLGGTGGVERSGVSSAVVTLHAVSPGASGGLRVWRDGATPSTTTVLSFGRAVTTSNVVLVPTSDDGTFHVYNASDAPVTLVVDSEGYVPTTDSPTVPTDGIARYLGKLTGKIDADKTLMGSYGNQDGAKAPKFVLLDVGAQTVSAPKLSRTNPGVVLALADEDKARYTYAQLVALVQSYLTALTESLPEGSTKPVVAVGTNNDGVWDPKNKDEYYAPDARGKDWATKVVGELDGYNGVKVRGADDIEPGFASTVTQALDWEKYFLAASTTDVPKLYFNGSADGCPVTWRPGTCNYGWTQSQLYDLASQPGVAAIPQIYTGSQAAQWAEISAVGARDGSGKGALRFAGILTESALDHDTLTPSQAASALTRGLRAVGSSPLPTYVADFAAN